MKDVTSRKIAEASRLHGAGKIDTGADERRARASTNRPLMASDPAVPPALTVKAPPQFGPEPTTKAVALSVRLP